MTEVGREDLKETWYIAWELHVDGFHEMKLSQGRLRVVRGKIRSVLDLLPRSSCGVET